LPELRIANDPEPAARYTLKLVTGTPEFAGAAQLNSTWCGFPTPLSATVSCGLVDELLAMLSWPLAEPVDVGLNVSVMLSVWPGFSVAGRLTDEARKPPPDTDIEFTVTAPVPLEVSVTV
jgi:hypothetical protein